MSHPARQCNLAALPTEVRLQIWQELFYNSCLLAFDRIRPLTERRRRIPESEAIYVARGFQWQITATSRGLREETLPLLCEKTVVEINRIYKTEDQIELHLPWTYRQHIRTLYLLSAEYTVPTEHFPALEIVEVWLVNGVDSTYRVSGEADVIECLEPAVDGSIGAARTILDAASKRVEQLKANWHDALSKEPPLELRVVEELYVRPKWWELQNWHERWRGVPGGSSLLSYMGRRSPGGVLLNLAFDLCSGRVVDYFDQIENARRHLCETVFQGVDFERCRNLSRGEAERTARVLSEAVKTDNLDLRIDRWDGRRSWLYGVTCGWKPEGGMGNWDPIQQDSNGVYLEPFLSEEFLQDLMTPWPERCLKLESARAH